MQQIQVVFLEVCGNNVPSSSHVTRWVKQFNNGRENAKDLKRRGRPVTLSDSYNVEIVMEAFISHHNFTCEEKAQELNIIHETFQSIIQIRLHMRTVSTRWVRHCLTSEQTERRLTVAIILLSRFKTGRIKFVSKIIAIDETWMR